MKKLILVIAVLVLLGVGCLFFFGNNSSQEFTEGILEDVGVELEQSEYDEKFAEETIDQLITPDEQQLLVTEGFVSAKSRSILFDYGELGKTLSLQKYLDTRGSFENPLTKSVNVIVDKPHDIKLRHQIMIGTDMAHWKMVMKESSYPELPFTRTYVLVQREGDTKGRMVGVSFYEGSYIEIEYEGSVSTSTIQLLVDTTERMAKRLPLVYETSLKSISEGPLFLNELQSFRADLPDPDLSR